MSSIPKTRAGFAAVPGIFSPKETDRLAKSMVHAAWAGVNESEAIVHVVDAPAHHRQKKYMRKFLLYLR